MNFSELLLSRIQQQLDEGRFAAALLDLDSALEQQPGNNQLRLLKAGALTALGDPQAALPLFEHFLERMPDAFLARLQYAECLQAANHPRALPEFFRAVNTAQAKGRWLNDDTTASVLRERVKSAMRLIEAGRYELFFSAIEPWLQRYGAAAMRRVSEGLESYLGLRASANEDARQRPTFLHVPDLRARPYFEPKIFPWYESLQDSTAFIRQELEQVLQRREGLQPFLTFSDESQKSQYLGGDARDAAWDAYFFYRHGTRHDTHHRDCPATSQALEQIPLTRIDDHAPEVLFSLLSPGTVIKPHHGVTNTRVVTHLPLIVPGDCALEVGGQIHQWQEGRCVTFDDSFSHQAWNRSTQLRVVMILDTWNPELREEEIEALRALVEEIGLFNGKAGLS